MKAALRKTYTKTPDIGPDGHAVTITFTDFKVDVVPGFYREGGGYLIPDSQRGRWLETDPKKHVDIWSAANKTHKGNLVPLIKMLKGWNKSRGVLRSFHLETLALIRALSELPMLVSTMIAIMPPANHSGFVAYQSVHQCSARGRNDSVARTVSEIIRK